MYLDGCRRLYRVFRGDFLCYVGARKVLPRYLRCQDNVRLHTERFNRDALPSSDNNSCVLGLVLNDLGVDEMNQPIYIGVKTLRQKGVLSGSVYVKSKTDDSTFGIDLALFNPDDLPTVLRCAVTAMRLSTAIGLRDFDVPRLLASLANDDRDAAAINGVIAAAKRSHSKNGHVGAWFETEPNQARSAGMNNIPRPDGAIKDRTCFLVSARQSEDRGAE